MKKKCTAESGLLSLRVLVVCAAGCLLVTGTLLAFFRSGSPATISQRTLTFAERIAYQRALEEIYWRHRIWPKDNPGPKPPLDAAISREEIEKKVTEYLHLSQFVADHLGRPISASEVQAEMDRMAQHSKRPEMLRELFEALGNDPFVIAECLARPILAERLAAAPGVVAGVSPAPTSLSAADIAASTEKRIRVATNVNNAQYNLPEISVPTDCTDDTWTATTTVNAPDVRALQTALWTGSEMIIWGGRYWVGGNVVFLNTGGIYCAQSGATPTPTATATATPTPTLTATATPNSYVDRDADIYTEACSNSATSPHTGTSPDTLDLRKNQLVTG
jgi:hypothetical protein